MKGLNYSTSGRRNSTSSNIIRHGLVLLCAITLSACGGGGGEGGSDNKHQTIAPNSPNNYLPTSSDTKWYYSDSADSTYATTTQIVGKTAQVLNYPTGGKEYFIATEDNLSFAGFYSPSTTVSGVGNFRIDFRFDESMQLLGGASRMSQFVSFTGTANIQPTYGTKKINVFGTSHVNGTESITVPFGTFDATHVTLNLSISSTIDGYYFEIPWNVDLWFAEGVGIIRRVQDGQVIELTNFSAPDVEPDNNGSTDNSGNQGNTGEDNSGDNGTSPTEPTEPTEPVLDTDNDGVLDINDHYPSDPTRHDKLAASLSSLNLSQTIGSSVKATQPLSITGTNLDWLLVSDATWLSVDRYTGNGDTSIQVSINDFQMSPGEYDSTLTLINRLDGSEIDIKVSAVLALPKLTLSTDRLIFDASDKWSRLSDSLEVSLNTGSYTYPVTLTHSNNFSASTAYASTIAKQLNIWLASPADISEGENHFSIDVSANVEGHIVSESIDIQVLASRHALLVPDRGVALTQFATKSRLSAELDILDSYHLTDTAWTASSNMSWLTITPSGTTSDKLLIEANVEGLAHKTLHQAEIVVSASSDTILDSESIKVSLWIDDTDPELKTNLAGEYHNIAADPVKPYVYVSDSLKDSAEISVYNSHTLEYVAGLELGGTHRFGDMKVSEDGHWLYSGIDNNSIAIFNLETFALHSVWKGNDDLADMFDLAELSGQPLIVAPGGNVYDAQSGKRLTIRGDGHWYAYSSWYTRDHYVDVSLFGNRFCAISFYLSPYTLNCYEINYNSYRDDVNVNHIGTAPHGTGSNASAVAVNSTGTIVYPASGSPYSFPVIEINSMNETDSLPADAYPNGITIGENDEVHGIVNAFYGPEDLWIYKADGVERFSGYASGGNNSLISNALAVSGDGYQTYVSDGQQLIIMNTY